MSDKKDFNQFCSTIKSCKYVFKNGKVANFVDGKYLTAIQSEIDELNAEIGAGNQFLYINKNEVTIPSTKADPMEVLKDKLRKEILAEMSEKKSPAIDFGTTAKTAPTAGLQTTKGIANIAVPVSGK